MQVEEKLALIAQHLFHAADLARNGYTARDIAAAVESGRFIRMRRGWYLDGGRWEDGEAADRHLAALLAANASAPGARIFSHRSAATLHGLPVWSGWLGAAAGLGSSLPEAAERDRQLAVEVIARGSVSGPSTPRLVRHRCELADADIGVFGGFTCTSPERTIVDLARTEPFAVAFACAEKHLRRIACTGRGVDLEAWAAWRERMLERVRRRPRMRGSVAVRMIAVLAGPESESELESISRLRLLQLGFEAEQQVPVRSETGGSLYLDFVLRGLGLFGECDGRAKYTDPEFRGGRSADQVLYDEKRRHDWVSGSTGWRGIRWGAPDLITVGRFGRRLREFRVPVPGAPTRAYGAEAAAFLRRLP
ncbi:hypothetical protein ACFPZL_10275 [Leucobacter soli]|uniref:Transcriptional regulator, AbiEi antitoxin, Type IV TA system n=1 Tax=Leucobacter soli TaxID=2812850 RepID=A0A916NX26_9MICO|nr:hypothetical protein [Leucobacter soli]CAG7622043.1 hypothetical protein LEUCIP111803_02473 [Leucobacter soli]